MKNELTATIIETHRDVKWICRTLAEMKKADEEFDDRIRTLEGWRAETSGADKGARGIVAGVGGVVGAFAAWVVQWFGVG